MEREEANCRIFISFIIYPLIEQERIILLFLLFHYSNINKNILTIILTIIIIIIFPFL